MERKIALDYEEQQKNFVDDFRPGINETKTQKALFKELHEARNNFEKKLQEHLMEEIQKALNIIEKEFQEYRNFVEKKIQEARKPYDFDFEDSDDDFVLYSDINVHLRPKSGTFSTGNLATDNNNKK